MTTWNQVRWHLTLDGWLAGDWLFGHLFSSLVWSRPIPTHMFSMHTYPAACMTVGNWFIRTRKHHFYLQSCFVSLVNKYCEQKLISDTVNLSALNFFSFVTYFPNVSEKHKWCYFLTPAWMKQTKCFWWHYDVFPTLDDVKAKLKNSVRHQPIHWYVPAVNKFFSKIPQASLRSM